MKKIKYFALTLALVISFTTIISHAYPATYSVSVPKEKQEKTLWCWAASSVSILENLGTNTTQSDFCTVVKGKITNKAANDSEAQDGLSHYGYSSKLTTSYLSFNTIRLEIYNYERPIYMGWSWNSGGGHALVIDGYDMSSEDYVSYMDPHDGAYHYGTYDWVKGNSSNHVWDGTLYKIKN